MKVKDIQSRYWFKGSLSKDPLQCGLGNVLAVRPGYIDVCIRENSGDCDEDSLQLEVISVLHDNMKIEIGCRLKSCYTFNGVSKESNAMPLMSVSFEEQGPFCQAWSPDGRYLAFLSRECLYVYAFVPESLAAALISYSEEDKERENCEVFFVHTRKDSHYMFVPIGDGVGCIMPSSERVSAIRLAFSLQECSVDNDWIPSLILLHRKETNFMPEDVSFGLVNNSVSPTYLLSVCGSNGVEFYRFTGNGKHSEMSKGKTSLFASIFLEMETNIMPLHDSLSICNICSSPSMSYLAVAAVDGHFGVWRMGSITERERRLNDGSFVNIFSDFWFERLNILQVSCVDFSFKENFVAVGTWEHSCFVFQNLGKCEDDGNKWGKVLEIKLLPETDNNNVMESSLMLCFHPSDENILVHSTLGNKLILRHFTEVGTNHILAEVNMNRSCDGNTLYVKGLGFNMVSESDVYDILYLDCESRLACVTLQNCHYEQCMTVILKNDTSTVVLQKEMKSLRSELIVLEDEGRSDEKYKSPYDFNYFCTRLWPEATYSLRTGALVDCNQKFLLLGLDNMLHLILRGRGDMHCVSLPSPVTHAILMDSLVVCICCKGAGDMSPSCVAVIDICVFSKDGKYSRLPNSKSSSIVNYFSRKTITDYQLLHLCKGLNENTFYVTYKQPSSTSSKGLSNFTNDNACINLLFNYKREERTLETSLLPSLTGK